LRRPALILVLAAVLAMLALPTPAHAFPGLECSGGGWGLSSGATKHGFIKHTAGECPESGSVTKVATQRDVTVGSVTVKEATTTRTYFANRSIVTARAVAATIGNIGIDVAGATATSKCRPTFGIPTQTNDGGIVRIYNVTTGATIFQGKAPPNTRLLLGVIVLNEQTSETGFADSFGGFAEGSVNAVHVRLGSLDVILGHAQSDITCALPS
jgi:hypothetical protein